MSHAGLTSRRATRRAVLAFRQSCPQMPSMNPRDAARHFSRRFCSAIILMRSFILTNSGEDRREVRLPMPTEHPDFIPGSVVSPRCVVVRHFEYPTPQDPILFERRRLVSERCIRTLFKLPTAVLYTQAIIVVHAVDKETFVETTPPAQRRSSARRFPKSVRLATPPFRAFKIERTI